MARHEEDARTGWKARRMRGRNRGRRIDDDDRAAIRAARATLTHEVSDFNPEVQTTAPADGDYVSALSDADLVALYRQLHGRPPAPKAKRPAIERAVRAKQAEQRVVDDVVEAPPAVGEDNTELTLEQLADDQAEGDDV